MFSRALQRFTSSTIPWTNSAPIIGIMVSDYWCDLCRVVTRPAELTSTLSRILHKQKVDVPSMYRPHGRYWYTCGISMSGLGYFPTKYLLDIFRLEGARCDAYHRAPDVAGPCQCYHPFNSDRRRCPSLRSLQFFSPSKRSVDTLSEQDISFLFGCFAGSTIFLVLSYLFPAQESFVEETKLAFGDDHPETKQACDNDKTSECSKRDM